MKSLFLLLCASFVMKIPPFIAALSNSYTHTPTEKSFSIDDESDFRVSRRSHENWIQFINNFRLRRIFFQFSRLAANSEKKVVHCITATMMMVRGDGKCIDGYRHVTHKHISREILTRYARTSDTMHGVRCLWKFLRFLSDSSKAACIPSMFILIKFSTILTRFKLSSRVSPLFEM